MPRRGKVIKRIPKGDPIYNSVGVAKFINNIMKKGKKTIAEKILYGSFEIIKQRLKKDPKEVFEQALKQATPLIEVKPRRIGGANYQVPVEVKGDRGVALATRWILANAKKRSGKSMMEKLAAELIDTYNNTGATIKKKEDTHKMAEANRAFAHYRY